MKFLRVARALEYFFHPIIATMLTSGARLLLAMAQTWLSRHNGYYGFCDTDSLGVSPFHWKKLQQFFQPLNPFDEGEFLKLEKENYDDEGQLRDLWFYGISAKRYVLYTLDEKGEPEPVKWSSHGLGQIVHDGENEWEKQLWTNILRNVYGRVSNEQLLDRYRGEYAIAKLALTKPSLLHRVKKISRSKPVDQMSPFNFVLVGSPTIFDVRGRPIVPVTSFTRPVDRAPFQSFVDARTGRVYTEHTELYWKTLGATVEEYMNHSESKFENGDKSGVMHRRHLIAEKISHIGKESNELEESELGVSDEPFVKYDSPTPLQPSNLR